MLGIQTFMFILIRDSGKIHGIERLLKYNILMYKNVLNILIKKKKNTIKGFKPSNKKKNTFQPIFIMQLF